jgi:GR25 family glycosyltransferase involved in LPS biosynthesis
MNSTQPSQVWTIDSIPAFCITLERRQDRWKRFQDQPGIKGLQVKRFLGVDGKTLDVKTDPRISTLTKRNIIAKMRRSHEEIDSIGAIGCTLSHMNIWKWMVDHQAPLCFVFEDDAVVPPDFIARANAYIKESPLLQDPSQWNVWLLGGKWGDITPMPNEKNLMIRIGAFMCTHAYVVTLDTASRFLQDALPIQAHVDAYMGVYSYLNDFRLIGYHALCMKQYELAGTNIQSKKPCMICSVPTDYEENNTMVSHLEWRTAQACEVLLAGLVAYWLYKRYCKN